MKRIVGAGSEREIQQVFSVKTTSLGIISVLVSRNIASISALRGLWCIKCRIFSLFFVNCLSFSTSNGQKHTFFPLPRPSGCARRRLKRRKIVKQVPRISQITAISSMMVMMMIGGGEEGGEIKAAKNTQHRPIVDLYRANLGNVRTVVAFLISQKICLIKLNWFLIY